MPTSTRSGPTRRALVAGAATLGALRPARAGLRRTLTVAMPNPSQFATLEPVREYSNVAFRVGFNLYDNLIAVDFRDGFKLVPSLATAWRRVSPTELDFDLRPGVTFHDGSPLTAEDVAFSFGPERLSQPTAPGYALSRPFLATLDTVAATGPLSVRVATRSPDPLIEKRLAGWCGQIVSKRAFLAVPSFSAWERAPVGTGPFKVGRYDFQTRTTLEPHTAYWGGSPSIGPLEFRVVPEQSSRITMLATGEADLVTELAPDQIKSVEAIDGCHVVGGPIMNIRVLVYDATNPVLADPRVRRALSLAIDRKLIVETLYDGRTTVPNGHQHPSYGPLYVPDYAGPGFDPDKARSLLKQAGYAGAPILYRILNNYYTLQVQTAQVLLEMWRAVGLNVQLEVKENVTQVLDANGRGIYDSSDTIFWQDPVGALVRRYGPTSAVQAQYKTWSHAEFNALCATLQNSLDTAERRRAVIAAMTIYDETDPPGTTLHMLTMFYGKRRALTWTPYEAEFMDFRAANMT